MDGRGGAGRAVAACGLALALAGSIACRHKPPRTVAALADQLQEARVRCVEAYAPEAAGRAAEAVARAEEAGRSWHRIRARRLAVEAAAAIHAAQEEAAARQEEAHQQALAAIEKAGTAVASAAAEGDGSTDAGDTWRRELNSAETLLEEARRLVDFHPCEYPRAATVAGEAEAAAIRSKDAAVRRREELEQEEQKRKDLEAARRRENARKRAAEAEARRRRELQELVKPVGRWGVAQGECLWRIAADPRVFGDPFQWPLLFHANRLQIADPDLILPGQSFIIPRGSTPGEVAAAIREARDRVWPTPGYLFDGK